MGRAGGGEDALVVVVVDSRCRGSAPTSAAGARIWPTHAWAHHSRLVTTAHGGELLLWCMGDGAAAHGAPKHSPFETLVPPKGCIFWVGRRGLQGPLKASHVES